MQINSDGPSPLGVQASGEGSCLKGRYTLVRALPLAEPGLLFAGRDQRTGEMLRIRSMPASNLTETVRVAIRDEAHRLMTIRRSDYFPRVRDLIEADGSYYLVQEGLDGITLWDFLNEDSPALPDRFRIAHIFRQTADRLTYLHNHIQGQILFRDLTPERILIDQETRLVRLVDFALPGMAAGLPSDRPGAGTRQTLAPELFHGHPHSVLTDVYALGRVLQFLVFGETSENPDPSTPIPTAVGRGVPDTFRELVQRMIAPDPSLRPPSVEAARLAFEACLDPAQSPFALDTGGAGRNLCPACRQAMGPDDLFCTHCGTPNPAALRRGDAVEDDSLSFHVTGLDREQFRELKPISLERFTLMKMSARVARLGNYENLTRPPHEARPTRHLPLAETLDVLRDLRGRAVLVGPDPLDPIRIAETLLVEYRHRGWVNRSLILAPGNLAMLWHHRLAVHHGVEARIHDPEDNLDFRMLPDKSVLIAAPDHLRRRQERDVFLDTGWDLAIVDAAHLFTSRGSHRRHLLESIRTKYLLLITSTPIQDDTGDLLGLLRLVRPDLWNISPQDFRASLDNTRPAIRDKVARTLVEVVRPPTRVNLETTYALAEPEGEAAELYHVILNSLASNTLEPATSLTIKQALISASPRTLLDAARDETAAALVAGVRALQEGDRHPKIHHLLTHVVPAAEEKFLVFADDPAVRTQIVDHLNRTGTRAVSSGSDPALPPTAAYRSFTEDAEVRALVLGDNAVCPPLTSDVNTAVLFDLPWDPTVLVERINQLALAVPPDRTFTLLQLIAPGTVEEWLFDLYRDNLQVYTPAAPIWHAFQAVMHESETFPALVREVAMAGLKGCHGTQRARNLQERIAGVQDHMANARHRSEDMLRLVRQEEVQ